MAELSYQGPHQLRVNQLFTATLQVRLDEPIKTSGRFVLATRHVSDFGDAQMNNPSAENYISVSSNHQGLAWELGPAQDSGRHPWNRGIELILKTGELRPGDTVTIILGDPAGNSPGFRCQSFTEQLFRFRLGIKTTDTSEWQVVPVESSPGFEIVGAEASRLVVTVASPTTKDKELRVCVKPEDVYGNVAAPPAADIRLLLDEHTPLKQVSLKASGPTVTNIPRPGDDHWHNLVVASDDGRFLARSNPFGSAPVNGLQLYWGEIHAQSVLCDGTNSPAALYDYARDAAGLDFASVTSHDFELTPDDWTQIKTAARQANQPGRFVTFLGYEWSGGYDRGGDHNIYFLTDDGPLVYNSPRSGPAARKWEPATAYIDRKRTLTETIQELGKHQVMIIPHCGGRRCNFDFYDPRVMPLFEIHSCHKNYEDVAQEALGRGLKLGFIGGSDDHRGAMGDSHPAARERFFSCHNGLVAVYARELTRASLWEAFFARRTYATNGPRIVLDFRVNDVLMGGEVEVKTGKDMPITFFTRLDGMLDRVELIRGTEIIKRFSGKDNQIIEFQGSHSEPGQSGVTPYYLRVYQTDGGTAWSSPVWVTGK